MSSQEKCPLFPSLLKSQCSHCQGTARGTRDNPRFSLREGQFRGYPVVEVLKDGASIHWWDSHFQFGRRKAEVMLTCVDLLRQFWRSNGDESDAIRSQIVENRERNLRIRVFVDKQPNFERSDGEIIEKSWLRLQALPPDHEHIGLGITKCRAICELEEELLRWVRKIRRFS